MTNEAAHNPALAMRVPHVRARKLPGGPCQRAYGVYLVRVSLTVGAELFACLFDQERIRYAAQPLGPVSALDGDSVTCLGLVFNLRLDHVYTTRAEAERAAERLNALTQGDPPDSPAD